MNNVLLVSGSHKGKELLSQFIKSDFCSQITIAANGGETRRILLDNDFDLVVINTPLPDEFGHDLAASITENINSGVILIVKGELADEISEKVEDFGVLVVPKPLSKQSFYQSVKLVLATRNRLLALQNENLQLQNKIEEIRLIARAKCVLIQYLNMTEPQAHRYIEKQAMDTRTTKKEIALELLKTYETQF